MAAQLLRQRLQQRLHLVADHARNEPLATRRVDHVERVQRHRHRHAVARRTGVEQVVERERDAAGFERLRERVAAGARGLVAHQLVAIEIQQPRLAFRRVAIPGLEGRAARDRVGNARVAERDEQRVVDQHVGPTRLVLELLDGRDLFPVVREKAYGRRVARVVRRLLRLSAAATAFTMKHRLDQSLAKEDLPRMPRGDRRVVDASLSVDRQPVDGAALEHEDRRGLFLPVRVAVRRLQQVRADRLDPFGFDARDLPREELLRLDQFGGDDPARLAACRSLAGQRRARPDAEADAAGAEVLRVFFDLEADVAEQAGEQRLVDRVVGRGPLVRAPMVLGHRRRELVMDVAPLAHAERRHEARPAQFAQLALRLAMRALAGFARVADGRRVPVPELQVGQEVGAIFV